MVSFKLAAIKILKDAKEPLHYEEITKRALKKNLIETTGSTPEATMNAQISVDIKAKQEKSPFVRAKPGVFALNPSFTEKEEKVEEQEGDVLVTAMTSPDFFPLMKKTSAIVTNLGGITCHAAILARELGKPCVIGTEFATTILKDGDIVEVDAEKGVVRKLS